jgi:hypothetical protein
MSTPAPHDHELTHPIRAAMLARDLDRIAIQLAPDVVFLAAASRRPFRGRDEVAWLLGHVLDATKRLEYVHESRHGNQMALGFHLTLHNDVTVEGLELVTLDSQNRFTEARLHARPLAALAELAVAIGPRLARRHGRLASFGARAGGRALAGAAQLSDRAAERLI